mmetsp:Transcript_7526/g.12704  ORF Transcript_7526/g.12704 Transcript_7526/m.12704 type:complete len:150 (-) Transcript_7526:330-779(-)
MREEQLHQSKGLLSQRNSMNQQQMGLGHVDIQDLSNPRSRLTPNNQGGQPVQRIKQSQTSKSQGMLKQIGAEIKSPGNRESGQAISPQLRSEISQQINRELAQMFQSFEESKKEQLLRQVKLTQGYTTHQSMQVPQLSNQLRDERSGLQ